MHPFITKKCQIAQVLVRGPKPVRSPGAGGRQKGYVKQAGAYSCRDKAAGRH